MSKIPHIIGLILKGIYLFFHLLVKRRFDNNPLLCFPEPNIPTFQYSNILTHSGMSEATKFFGGITCQDLTGQNILCLLQNW